MRCLLAIAFFALAPAVTAQEDAWRAAFKASPAAFALTHVTVVDGSGGSARLDMTVVVRGGRIASLASSAAAGAPLPEVVLDGRGQFVVPGFIDTHAHVTYLDWTSEGNAAYDDVVTQRSLRVLLAFGVTTVRNPGGPTREAVALRERVRRGEVAGPAIVTAGAILNRARRFDGLTRPVETEADVRREIAAQAAAGVDFVKLYASLPPDLVGAAVRAAHAEGLRVAGHLQATTWAEAARLGIDALCHGASWAVDELPPDRREAYRRAIAEAGPMRARIAWLEAVQPEGPRMRATIAEIAKRRIPVDPTLIAYATKFMGDDPRYLGSPDLSLAPPAMRSAFERSSLVRDWTGQDFARGRRAWPKMQALVRAYHEGGVLLTAGSDEPNPWIVPGPGLHTELELLVESGLSPLEILRIATRNGAESLGILDEVGTVAVGKRADLVVLTRDPTRDIRNTRSIHAVVRNGTLHDPSALLATAPAAVGPARETIPYAVPDARPVERTTVRYRVDPEMLADVHEPSGRARKGVVILVHGTAPASATQGPKDWPFFREYARVLAQAGFAAVVPNHRLGLDRPDPEAAEDDLGQLYRFLVREGRAQPRRGAHVFLFSGAGVLAGPLLAGGPVECRTLVALYPTLDATSLRAYGHLAPSVRSRFVAANVLKSPRAASLPMLLLRAGRDDVPGVNASVDRFVGEALTANVDLRLINVPDARHGMETSSPESDVRAVMDDLIAFLSRASDGP